MRGGFRLWLEAAGASLGGMMRGDEREPAGGVTGRASTRVEEHAIMLTPSTESSPEAEDRRMRSGERTKSRRGARRMALTQNLRRRGDNGALVPAAQIGRGQRGPDARGGVFLCRVHHRNECLFGEVSLCEGVYQCTSLQHHHRCNIIIFATSSSLQHHHRCNIIIFATSSSLQHHHLCNIIIVATSSSLQHRFNKIIINEMYVYT